MVLKSFFSDLANHFQNKIDRHLHEGFDRLQEKFDHLQEKANAVNNGFAAKEQPKQEQPFIVGKYNNVGAIAVASTEDYQGQILSVALVDSNYQTVLHNFYRPNVRSWNEHYYDYGLSYEQLFQCPPFEECVSGVQDAIDHFDLLLCYDLYQALKTLANKGVMFKMPVVGVKGAHLDFLGGATITVDIFTGESHSDFDKGKTTLETACNTMTVFRGLPASLQNEYIGKAEDRLERRKRNWEWDAILKRKEEATPEPCMEVPDIPEWQRPFGRKEYLRTVEMRLDEDMMPYEYRRWYHADPEALDEVVNDMRALLDMIPNSNSSETCIDKDHAVVKMTVAPLLDSGKRRKYPIIVEYTTDDPASGPFDYDNDDNPIDEHGNVLEPVPYITGRLYYLDNGDVGKADIRVESKKIEYRKKKGEFTLRIK